MSTQNEVIDSVMTSKKGEYDILNIAITLSLVEKPIKEVLLEYLTRIKKTIKHAKNNAYNIHHTDVIHCGIKYEGFQYYLGHSDVIDDFETDIPVEMEENTAGLIYRSIIFFGHLQNEHPHLDSYHLEKNEEKKVFWFTDGKTNSHYLGFKKKPIKVGGTSGASS